MENWYKHSRLFLILIGLLVIVLVVPVFGAMRIAQAESVTLAGFEVTYDGRTYDDVSDTSTFAYTVCAAEAPPPPHDLSHFTIEIPICYSESDVVAADPTGYIFGYDPKIGIRGIKWNFGLSSTPGTCRTYSFTLQGNIPEGTVEVGVKAGRIVHKGEITGPACPTPTPTIPNAPINLTATAVSSSQINLSWTDNSDNEDGFKIERKTELGSYSPLAEVGAGVDNYSDTGLDPDTTYYYRVRAYNDAGDSAPAEDNDTTLPEPGIPPNPPTNLIATAVSYSQIDLSWDDNSDNEDGFKIERKTGAGGTYSQIATVGPNVTTYPDTGLIPCTTYFYRVMAYNAAGNSAYSNVASATTPDLAGCPCPPTNLTATAVSSSQINLSWEYISNNEDRFKIERKTGAGGTYSQIEDVGPNVTTYPNTGLNPDTTYYYQVRAYNDAGDSDYSNEAWDTTLPLSPPPSSRRTVTPTLFPEMGTPGFREGTFEFYRAETVDGIYWVKLGVINLQNEQEGIKIAFPVQEKKVDLKKEGPPQLQNIDASSISLKVKGDVLYEGGIARSPYPLIVIGLRGDAWIADGAVHNHTLRAARWVYFYPTDASGSRPEVIVDPPDPTPEEWVTVTPADPLCWKGFFLDGYDLGDVLGVPGATDLASWHEAMSARSYLWATYKVIGMGVGYGFVSPSGSTVYVDDLAVKIAVDEDDPIYVTYDFEPGASGGGGCFIATAAYGTPLAAEIEVLRQFRDEYLLTNPPGRLFVSVYYRSSPPLADFIDDHPTLKPMVRAGLSPAVALTAVVVNTTSAQKLAIVGGLTLVSLALVTWLRRRAGGVKGTGGET